MDVQNIIGKHLLTGLHRVGSSLPFENLKILKVIGDELIHYMPGAFGMALPLSVLPTTQRQQTLEVRALSPYFRCSRLLLFYDTS